MAHPIRIGIIGAGNNTRNRHIPGLQEIKGVEIACVANRTLASGRKVAKQFGIPTAYGHWEEVIEDDGVDAVCIGTWPYLHAPATVAALEMGKHVLVEARMATNADEARWMLSAAQQSGLVAQIVPSPFGLAGESMMLDLIHNKGFLGQVREIYMRNLGGALLDAKAKLTWRLKYELSGLNALALGIFYETVQRWFGMAESVFAQTSNFVPLRKDEETGRLTDVTTPESAHVLARWAGGASGVFHFTGHAAHGGGPRLEAYGTAGTLVYDFASDTITGGKPSDKQLKKISVPKAKQGGWRVEADFIDSIRKGAPVTHTNFVDGLKYMRFAEAVATSAAEHRRVALAEV